MYCKWVDIAINVLWLIWLSKQYILVEIKYQVNIYYNQVV